MAGTDSAARNYTEIALRYAEDVVAGLKPACKWVKKAAKRFLDDLEREQFAFVFHADKADAACAFLELLPHTKAEWGAKGLKLVLSDWQVFITCQIFGWVHCETGLRRFRKVYIEVPRKNGKSTWIAGIAIYCAFFDNEAGAEVYSAATTRDQARIVFGAAKQMVRKTPPLQNRFGITPGAHSVYDADGSFIQALSSDSSNLDGLNIHCAVIDELHAHKTRDVYDVIDTATGARAQSLIIEITTAGTNSAGICYEERDYVTKILDRVFEDESVFGIIYTIDEGDDVFARDTWIKANPNFGISVKEDDLARKALAARMSSGKRIGFMTKHLNIWHSGAAAWMDMEKWHACADKTLNRDDFRDDELVVALDLASKKDFAARADIFRREIDDKMHYYLFPKLYLNEEAVDDSPVAQLKGWVDEDFVDVTEGNTTDFDRIEQDVKDLRETHNLVKVGADPYQARMMLNHLVEELGEDAAMEYRQHVGTMSEPMKTLEALVREGRFHHDGNPVMAWMVSNVACKVDRKDNIYPIKQRLDDEGCKIDGAVAAIMGVGLYVSGEIEQSSVYEDRSLASV